VTTGIMVFNTNAYTHLTIDEDDLTPENTKTHASRVEVH
jgi:hypothetical protein